MGDWDGCVFCGGCGVCWAVIAWWVCGILAVIWGQTYAEECGWWLWGAFIGELIYLPFAIAFSTAYACGALVSITSSEPATTESACVDGFGRAVSFAILNCINAAILGTAGYAMQTEDCIPPSTWLYPMSRVGFWTCAVLTGLCTILGLAEAGRLCCAKCAR